MQNKSTNRCVLVVPLLGALLASATPAALWGQANSVEARIPSASSSTTGFQALDGAGPVPAVLVDASAISVSAEYTAGPIAPQVTGKSGRTYMIAGAAALIGGLLIGQDLGTLIAAGGVVLGVYGIILYY